MTKKVERTRGDGKYTEAQYWGMVRSSLRRGFRWWPPIMNCKNAARREYEKKGRQKWEYKCNRCGKWWKGSEVQVDHIVPVGSLNKKEDLASFVERLTAEDGYQVLCKECHKQKGKEDRDKKK